MLNLDDDELDLAWMALIRVEAELLRQMADRSAEGSAGAAYFANKFYCAPKIRALLARIDEYQQDMKEERAYADLAKL
jgi:hypothetical protein